MPPIAQWILDTLPVLAAAARGGSRDPLNLRLSITMNQSVSGLMPPRKAGLIDLERVVREYQSSSRGQAELEAVRQRTDRELRGREYRMRSLGSRLAEVESALNEPPPVGVTEEWRQDTGGREGLMREAAALRVQVADQAGGTEVFRLRRAAQLEDAESRLARSLRAEVIRHLQEKARQGQFDFLLDTSALIPGTGSLLSLDTRSADIGPEVLEELRQP
ncbi:MAG: OmpH family outer membrane protein [Verrucomicrobiaceae bacterium]|nr:MAG: OmpH family outer membrane protein [Verrucomicrobiaceae bacterium]